MGKPEHSNIFAAVRLVEIVDERDATIERLRLAVHEASWSGRAVGDLINAGIITFEDMGYDHD